MCVLLRYAIRHLITSLQEQIEQIRPVALHPRQKAEPAAGVLLSRLDASVLFGLMLNAVFSQQWDQFLSNFLVPRIGDVVAARPVRGKSIFSTR
jgi:hypothetical protein